MAASKAYKAEHFDAVEAEKWRNYRGMEAIYSGRVTWSKWVEEPNNPGARYRLGVFDRRAADGGHCITVFDYPNQRPQLNVYGWEDFKAIIRDSPAVGIRETLMRVCIVDVVEKLMKASAAVQC